MLLNQVMCGHNYYTLFQPTVVTYNTDPGVGSVTANGLPLNKTGMVCVFTGCFTLNNLGSTLYADSRKVPCSAGKTKTLILNKSGS